MAIRGTRALCMCQRQCERRIDRAALQARLTRSGGEAPAWLAAGEAGVMRFPYHDVDGLEVAFDGEGRVTRCSHSMVGDPSATVAIACATPRS